MHLRRLAAASVLAIAAAAVVVPAHAAVPTCDGLDATIVGTDGPDHLTGTEGPDVVVLGGGNDVFAGKGGDDVICGGAGNDVIYPGAGNDTVFGQDGSDHIYEGPGDDHLNGGAGSNVLDYSLLGTNLPDGAGLRLDARIGKATSTLGTDLFYHFDSFVGSYNKDTLIGSAAKERIVANGGTGDVLYGFGGADRLVGNSLGVVIDGGDGDDLVRISDSGAARVRLGAGDDTLLVDWRTGPGSVFVGGAGLDAVVLITGTAGYDVNLNRGFLRHNGNQAADRSSLSGFENVRGSAGPDRIVGNELSNFLAGNGGDDTVIGLGGDDHLFGSNGLGNGGYDVADGGPGHDWCLHFSVVTSCAVTD